MDYQNKPKSPGLLKTDFQQRSSVNPGNRLNTGGTSLKPTGQAGIQKTDFSQKKRFNPGNRINFGGSSLKPTGNSGILKTDFQQKRNLGKRENFSGSSLKPTGNSGILKTDYSGRRSFEEQRREAISGIIQSARQKIMENQGGTGKPTPTLGTRANPVKSLEQFRQERLNPPVSKPGANGNLVMSFNNNQDREYMNPLYDKPEYYQGDRQQEYSALADKWNSMDRKEMEDTWGGDQKAFVSFHQGQAEAGQIIKDQMKDGGLDFSAESKQMQQIIGKNPAAAKKYAGEIKQHMATMDAFGIQ